MNEKVVKILTEKKVKPTAVRELVLDVFLKTDYAISLSYVENILTWSDKVTIYRTLKTVEKIRNNTSNKRWFCIGKICIMLR